MTLYFAYGSNLNVEQMKQRCPKAEPVAQLFLRDYRLVFRGVADIEPAEGSLVAGALWKITRKCEKALDRYEGVKWNTYRKEYLTLDASYGLDISEPVLTYRMNDTVYCPPSPLYFHAIAKGYRDFELPLCDLREGLRFTYEILGGL